MRVLAPSLITLVLAVVIYALSGGVEPLDAEGEPRTPGPWFAGLAIFLMIMAAIGLGVSAWVWVRQVRRPTTPPGR